MNKALLVSVLLASCGTVTPLPSDGGTGEGGRGGTSSGGAPGAGGSGTGGMTSTGGASGAAGAAGAGGSTGGTATGGKGGSLAGCVIPQRPPNGSTWIVSGTWCGNGCGTCDAWQSPCTFPTTDVTDNNGSSATCDFDTLITNGMPTFSITENEPTSNQPDATWTLSADLAPNYCKTIPAFTCAPTCAACP